jgi:SagB-type dehydrogenase family enzyme
MDNRDISAARTYHGDTKHSEISIRSTPHFLDWPNQPLPFKLYRDLEPRPLPKEGESSSVAALDAIAEEEEELQGEREPDLNELARIFHFSAGITKAKTYAGGQILFRAAACTGALYHIELYLACRELPGLEAGLYHFGPSDFGLRKLRDGDWRAVLVEASGDEPSLVTAPAVILFTSTFWRNSWKYRQRAYRHSFWDSGTLMANLLAEAASMELPARIVLGFRDDLVNRLLDVDPHREVALGLVAVGRVFSPPPSPPGPIDALGYETVPLSPSEVDYPEIRGMHQASVLERSDDVARWRGAPPERKDTDPGGQQFTLDASSERRDPLEEVILRRTPITFAELSVILDRTTRGIRADYLEPFGAYINDLYLIVNAVGGLPSGTYVYQRERKALEQLREGEFRQEAGRLDLGQELAADASVNIYAMCDLEPVLERYGNRGYRAAQFEGGVLGGKVYLAAYAQGLGASGLTFFDDDVTRFFLPHAGGKSVMFLVAVGKAARRRVLFER